MNPEPRTVQRVYLVLMLFNTLAASFIWGINTLFLLDAGLNNTEAFAANAFFTLGMVVFEVPTGVVADTRGRRLSFLLGATTLLASTLLYLLMWEMHAPLWGWAVASVLLGLGFTFFSGATEAWLVDALRASGFVGDLVAQVAAVHAQGKEVVLVSSGAVAAGLASLGFVRRPGDLPSLQAAASVGQGALMQTYQECFATHGIVSGQVLLTPDDVVDRTRYLNARNTIERLLALRAVPVVNENDTVITDELRFGDNDRLAALVTSMLDARLLVLLTDVEGLLDRDPAHAGALVLDRVDDLAPWEDHDFGTAGSDVARGGMRSKLEAVRIARFSAAHAVIAHARRPAVVREVIAGMPVGTWFPRSSRA
jgi:isopentenyl phosphate kinase